MRIVVLNILILLNIILESTVFQYIRIIGIKPDFTMMLIVSYALMRGSAYGGYVGLAAGLLQDLIYGRAFGINGLSYMLTGYIIGYSQDSVFKDCYIPPIILNAAGIFIYQNLFFIVNYFSKADISYLFGLVNIMIPQIIYNGVLSSFVYRVIFNLDEKEFMDRKIY